MWSLKVTGGLLLKKMLGCVVREVRHEGKVLSNNSTEFNDKIAIN